MTTQELEPKPLPKRKRGRQRVGDVRLEIMIPRLLYLRLLEREQATGTPVTRVAADILFRELLG